MRGNSQMTKARNKFVPPPPPPRARATTSKFVSQSFRYTPRERKGEKTTTQQIPTTQQLRLRLGLGNEEAVTEEPETPRRDNSGTYTAT